MSCGCGMSASQREATIQMTNSTPTRNGGYLLGSYPDCSTLHLGKFQGSSIFVVDRLGEFERLFPRTQLAEASAYAREVRRDIENLPTAALCDAAVLAVYG